MVSEQMANDPATNYKNEPFSTDNKTPKIVTLWGY